MTCGEDPPLPMFDVIDPSVMRDRLPGVIPRSSLPGKNKHVFLRFCLPYLIIPEPVDEGMDDRKTTIRHVEAMVEAREKFIFEKWHARHKGTIITTLVRCRRKTGTITRNTWTLSVRGTMNRIRRGK